MGKDEFEILERLRKQIIESSSCFSDIGKKINSLIKLYNEYQEKKKKYEEGDMSWNVVNETLKRIGTERDSLVDEFKKLETSIKAEENIFSIARKLYQDRLTPKTSNS
jgi:predicted nuclease with TOPRIM domain